MSLQKGHEPALKSPGGGKLGIEEEFSEVAIQRKSGFWLVQAYPRECGGELLPCFMSILLGWEVSIAISINSSLNLWNAERFLSVPEELLLKCMPKIRDMVTVRQRGWRKTTGFQPPNCALDNPKSMCQHICPPASCTSHEVVMVLLSLVPQPVFKTKQEDPLMGGGFHSLMKEVGASLDCKGLG